MGSGRVLWHELSRHQHGTRLIRQVPVEYGPTVLHDAERIRARASGEVYDLGSVRANCDIAGVAQQ
jgi:hypothetical protein